jgi:DNA mismatch endonuclease (patch repair protein)
MADVFSKAKRSEVMSRIRSRGNKDTELALARLLRANGISGWRRHSLVRVASCKWQVTRKARASVLSPVTRHPSLTVRPDFVFSKSRTAVFVDGCFWHGCPKHATKPANNRAFWQRKLAGNKARDRLVTRTLRAQGWRVVRIWEHELQKAMKRSTPHLASGHPLPVRGGEGEARLVRRILARTSGR